MAHLQREWPSVPPETEFPVAVRPPPGFDPDDLTTWPRDPGRFEYVDGRLLYLPPCGEIQGGTVGDVYFILRRWQEQHLDFVVRTNEIGVSFGRDKRGIDVAVWRRSDVGTPSWGFAQVPPLLAVEVAGQDDREPYLRDKAAWYLARGVTLVWLVLPASREVVVLAAGQETRHGIGQELGSHDALPGLEPAVADFFRQLG
jgi:Uma2 family endonuclease